MGFFSGVSGTIKKIGKQVSQNTTNAGATPFQVLGGVTAKSIQGVAPAIGAASRVIAANPALAQAGAGLLGAGALGSFFGSPTDAAGSVPASNYAPATAPPSGNNTWLYLAAAAAVVAFLVLRK